MTGALGFAALPHVRGMELMKFFARAEPIFIACRRMPLVSAHVAGDGFFAIRTRSSLITARLANVPLTFKFFFAVRAEQNDRAGIAAFISSVAYRSAVTLLALTTAPTARARPAFLLVFLKLKKLTVAQFVMAGSFDTIYRRTAHQVGAVSVIQRTEIIKGQAIFNAKSTIRGIVPIFWIGAAIFDVVPSSFEPPVPAAKESDAFLPAPPACRLLALNSHWYEVTVSHLFRRLPAPAFQDVRVFARFDACTPSWRRCACRKFALSSVAGIACRRPDKLFSEGVFFLRPCMVTPDGVMDTVIAYCSR